jgi:hypothetical protein
MNQKWNIFGGAVLGLLMSTLPSVAAEPTQALKEVLSNVTADRMDQVTSVSQLSDVQPTD